MAKKLIYGLDDNPPFTIMVLAGVQHVLTLFDATTLVPLIFGPAMGMDDHACVGGHDQTGGRPFGLCAESEGRAVPLQGVGGWS